MIMKNAIIIIIIIIPKLQKWMGKKVDERKQDMNIGFLEMGKWK